MAPQKKVCPECGDEFYAFQLPAHLFREHGIGDPPRTRGATKKKSSGGGSVVGEVTEPPPSSADDPAEGERPPAVVEGITDDETAPRKPSLMERFRGRRGRGRGGQHQAPVPGERAPRAKRPSRRRVALDADISDVWAFGGRRLEHTPHYPTGRMLQYQAPAAGVIIDRAIAGTLPDRILFQPIARNRDKYEDVGFLLAGPLLTFTITSTMQQMQGAIDEGDKELYDSLVQKLEMQREMFTWVLSMMLPRLAAGAKLAREKKAKADAVIADAFPELGDDDPVNVLANMLFVPPTFEEAQTNGKPDSTAPAPAEQGSVPFGG
jgi:hypothetical protein